jgi:hypothetical protein
MLNPGQVVTHHITPNFSPSAAIASSLLYNGQFVKPEWLTELIKSANDDQGSFSVPSETKYRPSFSTNLKKEHKTFKTWEQNEERLGLFKKFRFLCVGEKGREVDSETRGLIEAGNGGIEVVTISYDGDARGTLKKALKRASAKEGKQIVPVGDVKVLGLAVGKDVLTLLEAELSEYVITGFHRLLYLTGCRHRYELEGFVHPDSIIQAAIDADTSILCTVISGTNLLCCQLASSSSCSITRSSETAGPSASTLSVSIRIYYVPTS